MWALQRTQRRAGLRGSRASAGATAESRSPAAAPAPPALCSCSDFSPLAVKKGKDETFLLEIRPEHPGCGLRRPQVQPHLSTSPPAPVPPRSQGRGCLAGLATSTSWCDCLQSLPLPKSIQRFKTIYRRVLQLAFKPLIKDNTQEKLTPVALLGIV